MGGDDNVVHCEQRVAGGRRFFFKNIQPRTGDLPCPQRVDQSLLVHHGASGRVNEIGRRLHACKFLPAYQMEG